MVQTPIWWIRWGLFKGDNFACWLLGCSCSTDHQGTWCDRTRGCHRGYRYKGSLLKRIIARVVKR